MERIEDLPEDVQPIARAALELRTRNERVKAYLEKQGVDMETVNARLEHFGMMLVNAGIITSGQLWAINLDWEEMLNKQLMQARDKVETAIIRMQQERARGASPRLVTPPKPGKLIVPGQ